MGLARNKRIERVESGFEKNEAFEVSKGSWSTNKEHTEMGLDYTLYQIVYSINLKHSLV